MTPESTLTVTSPAFDDGESIPEKYAKDYENVNPPLRVTNVPEGTVSFALVVDDPDAPGGTFTHWLVWNIPPDIGTISEGWTPPDNVTEGTNDFGNVGYDGPRPPSKHTYRFMIHALESSLNLSRSASADDVESAMNGLVIARDRLTGTFAP